ncbi:hypothetical protein EDC56_1128 [Sinobacterium caligoides]|uniref:Uncharacterized protein n=1 Tax=Sinobacterium caligoides TaxID=933926 RepID=A0A3N2E0H7_9GAMM|nr:hypothetical protein [Sinobacterium caligoides]ROS05588.1 hypothetical protein EDC56_1128 [Sinobacterium caligoides]
MFKKLAISCVVMSVSFNVLAKSDSPNNDEAIFKCVSGDTYGGTTTVKIKKIGDNTASITARASNNWLMFESAWMAREDRFNYDRGEIKYDSHAGPKASISYRRVHEQHEMCGGVDDGGEGVISSEDKVELDCDDYNDDNYTVDVGVDGNYSITVLDPSKKYDIKTMYTLIKGFHLSGFSFSNSQHTFSVSNCSKQ